MQVLFRKRLTVKQKTFGEKFDRWGSVPRLEGLTNPKTNNERKKMYDAYQEHLDHVMGSQNEFQNAYALSCSLENEREIPVEGEGDFVVNERHLVYCGITDAVIGFRTFYQYRFRSFDEAFAFMEAKNEELYKELAETGDYPDYEFEIPKSQYPPVQGCDLPPIQGCDRENEYTYDCPF